MCTPQQIQAISEERTEMNLQELTQWYDFTEKTAVITGGTGVLGGEIACALVGCGANAAVMDRNPNLPENLKTPMDAGPGKYMVSYADVLQRDLLTEAAQKIRQAFGGVDILINAAGGNHPQATTNTTHTFFDLPTEAMDFVFDVLVPLVVALYFQAVLLRLEMICKPRPKLLGSSFLGPPSES